MSKTYHEWGHWGTSGQMIRHLILATIQLIMIKQVCAVVIASGVFALGALPARSAERVVVRFSDAEYIVDVGDIERFLLTGQTELPLPEPLKRNPLFRLAVMQLLRQEIPIASIKVDTTQQSLMNLAGEILLEQITLIIQGDRPKESLRQALNASIRGGKFNPLRFVRSYPEPELIINGDRLLELQKALGGL